MSGTGTLASPKGVLPVGNAKALSTSGPPDVGLHLLSHCEFEHWLLFGYRRPLCRTFHHAAELHGVDDRLPAAIVRKEAEQRSAMPRPAPHGASTR